MKLHDNRFHEGASIITLTNIHSVSDFQRNLKGILGQLKSSRSPVVLTVNGKPELVVQDAASYQLLLDKVEAAEDLEAIHRGLEQSLAGEGRPAGEFFREFEAQHGLNDDGLNDDGLNEHGV